LPCKGLVKGIDANLRAFLAMDYDPYEVVFTVESQSDPIVPVIEKICEDGQARGKSVRLVVAGLALTCCQKNHNLLAALQTVVNAEIYVFADADIGPMPSWLTELIAPLASEKITVTTGFRWLHASRGSLAEQCHFFMNTFLYTLYSTASFCGGVGLWGGSMAIRARDFAALHVARRWAETVVDDSSLSQIVKNHHKKSVLVPTCITHSDDLIQSVGAAVRWFTRQMMYLKAYQGELWLVAIPLITVAFVLMLLLLPAVLLSGLSWARFTALGGSAALLLVVGKYLGDILYLGLGPMKRRRLFFLVQPFCLLVFLYSCIKTAFTNTVTWAGVRYILDNKGRVRKLIRPERSL
jgi:cellulose synthase/poly-beta-1,6-N-acetylglucosamine synthase-like glycosyltransferase